MEQEPTMNVEELKKFSMDETVRYILKACKFAFLSFDFSHVLNRFILFIL